MNDLTPENQELTECSHVICKCTLTGPLLGETYCSRTCRVAEEAGRESETCACGHPQCDVP